ncbi:hypothetical protein [Herbiconiux solani]|uniref:hypothetical protein n=1 Tax=Herbiconiux solani TaxID=661329 RepID=UPI0012EDD458|nr:hypothetical protein [Herbiconiux solani]
MASEPRPGRTLAALPGGVIAGAGTGLLYPVAVLGPGLVRGDPSSSTGLLLIGMLVGTTLGMLVGALAGGLAAGLLALLWRVGMPAAPAALVTGVVVGGGVVAVLVWMFTTDIQTLALAALAVAQTAGGLTLLTWWAARGQGSVDRES